MEEKKKKLTQETRQYKRLRERGYVHFTFYARATLYEKMRALAHERNVPIKDILDEILSNALED